MAPSLTYYETENPVTLTQQNPKDTILGARVYAPSGAAFDAQRNNLYIDSGAFYLLPNFDDATADKLARELTGLNRTGTGFASVKSPSYFADYDPYTDFIINQRTTSFTFSQRDRFLSVRPTGANRQIIDIDKIASPQFRLTWNGQTTESLKKTSSAQEIEEALNKLPNIGGAGGFVAVSDVDSAEGANAAGYVVTFGGSVWFDPPLIKVDGTNVAISTPAMSLLLSTQDSGQVTVNLDSTRFSIPNGFASPLYNVESFVPTDVDYTSSYYPNLTGKTTGTRVMKGLVETSGVVGQFHTTSSFNTVETLLGYRVVDIGSEYHLHPVSDPSGNPRPISVFSLNGLNFSVKAGTPFILKSADKAQTQLQFNSKTDSVEATAEFEGGSLTVRIDKGSNQPALRVDLRSGKVETSRFISFVSAEIGGIKFTSQDSVSFGVDTINSKFVIGLNNFTTTPDELTGAASSSFYENITQVFTPQSERGVLNAFIYRDQDTSFAYSLAAKKTVQVSPFVTRAVDDPDGIVDRASFAAGLQAELRRLVSNGSFFKLPSSLAQQQPEEREAIARNITVQYVPSSAGLPFGQFRVQGLPARLKLQLSSTALTVENLGIGSSPVRFTAPNMTITLANGVLQPIEDVTVSSVQIGETRVNSSGQYSTTFEAIELGTGSDLKLKYYPRYTSITNSDRTVPGNSFGFYGAQVPLALKVTGLIVGGSAATGSLGTKSDPGLLAVNGQFYELTLPVPEVTIDTMRFVTTTLDGFGGMRLNRRARLGEAARVYTVEGAAKLQGGVGLIKTDLNVLFGRNSTQGLQIFPDSNSYLTSFSIRKGFLIGAGLQAIGDGTYVEQDPLTRRPATGSEWRWSWPESPELRTAELSIHAHQSSQTISPLRARFGGSIGGIGACFGCLRLPP